VDKIGRPFLDGFLHALEEFPFDDGRVGVLDNDPFLPGFLSPRLGIPAVEDGATNIGFILQDLGDGGTGKVFASSVFDAKISEFPDGIGKP